MEKKDSTGKILLKRKERNFLASFCIIDKDLPSLLKNISSLNPNERHYFDTLKYDSRKKSYLLGRIATKKAILELFDIDIQSIFIDFGIFQFPVIKSVKNYNIQASISHCGNIGAALVYPEEHPLAIDIEKIKENTVTATKEQITKDEINLISECQIPLPIGCMVIWTVKEAISKIFKTGLTMDFKIFEIQSLKKDGFVYLSSFTHYTQYRAISFHSGDYICSIVLPKNTNPNLEQFWDSFSSTVLK